MLINFILYSSYLLYFWTILSTIRVCYKESKVGWPVTPYKKLIPFTIYNTAVSIIQLIHILPMSYFMTKYNRHIFIWNQIAWNFKILFPTWWGNIKWRGLQNIPTYNCIWVGNHQSTLDTAIMMMLPCKTPMIDTSGNGILSLFGISPGINFQKKCKEALNNGMSINIFPQGTCQHINKGILPLKREAFDLAHSTNVQILPYSISYKPMNITVRIHKPIYVNNVTDSMNSLKLI